MTAALTETALSRIRADVRAMHAYAVADATGLIKLDAMENPYELPAALRDELAQRHFKLLEGLAEYVAGLILDDFGALWVRVSLAKVGVMRDVRRVGVIIERSI